MKYLFVGPSGSGKTTLVKLFLKKYTNFQLSISYTTREMRKGEIDGEEYNFITKEEFLKIKNSGNFFETELVFGNYYGTHKKFLSKNVLFNLDVRGAINIKKQDPSSIIIFILPPSMEELKKRLINREEQYIQNRISEVRQEIANVDIADYCVINDNLESAFQIIESIHFINQSQQKAKEIIERL